MIKYFNIDDDTKLFFNSLSPTINIDDINNEYGKKLFISIDEIYNYINGKYVKFVSLDFKNNTIFFDNEYRIGNIYCQLDIRFSLDIFKDKINRIYNNEGIYLNDTIFDSINNISLDVYFEFNDKEDQLITVSHK